MSDPPETNNTLPPTMTEREQEILIKLLTGATPKEIAYDLKIAYGTFLTHQRNLYRKLDVHTINELLTKYSPAVKPKKKINKYINAVFSEWYSTVDELGSFLKFTYNKEFINDIETKIYSICGNVTDKGIDQTGYGYAGADAFFDNDTKEAIKTAKGFSFTALGDGNMYNTALAMQGDGKETDYYLYGNDFIAKEGVISTYNFYFDELTQIPFYGNEIPFNRNKIEVFAIHKYSAGNFNLKIWDIKLFS